MLRQKGLKCIGGPLDGKRAEDEGSEVLHVVVELKPLSTFDPNATLLSVPMTTYRRTRLGMGQYFEYVWIHQDMTLEEAFRRLILHYRPNDKRK